MLWHCKEKFDTDHYWSLLGEKLSFSKTSFLHKHMYYQDRKNMFENQQ